MRSLPRICTAFAFLLLSCLSLFSQPQNPSELRDSLSHLPADTQQVRLISDFLKTYYDYPTDTLLNLARQGYQLAWELDDKTGMATLKQHEAFAQIDAGFFEEGIQNFKLSHEIYLQVPDSPSAARMLINVGLSHYYEGNMDQALVQYEEAARWLDKLNSPESRLYNNMAVIYSKQEKYDQAIELYEKSFAMKEADGDSLGMAATYMNLGLQYCYQGDTLKAIRLCQKSIDYYGILGRLKDQASGRVSLGNIYRQLGYNDEAQEILEQAYDYLKDHPEGEYLHYTLFNLGDLAEQKGDLSTAADFFERALKIATQKGRLENEKHITQRLAEAWYKQGKYKPAFPMLQRSVELWDTLTHERRLALTEEMQARFEVGEKENELLKKELELAKKEQNERIGWALLGSAALLILGISYFLYQKNRTNNLLAEKNKVIEQSLREKDLLMREIHHRVKNNLQFISSLLRLQTRHMEDEQAREALLASRSRVLSMSLIHQHLYQDQNLTGIHLDTYLDRLVTEIIGASHIEWDKLKVRQDWAPIVVDVDTAIPLGLIVNELVVNALKYAFSETGGGELSLGVKKTDTGMTLWVQDNGPGIEKEKESQEEGNSFGYRLINLLVEKLKAEMTVSAGEVGGSLIELTIPNR